MTEKKRQSTVQSEQVQGFNSSAEDELNLIDLLKFLVRKKVLILAVTSVCTLLSIFYVQSITPIYRATIGLLDPKEKLLAVSSLEQIAPGLGSAVFNQTEITFTKTSIFERFLSQAKSNKLKQEIFVNGGFQEKFFRGTGINTYQSVSEIYDSTKFVLDGGNADLNLEGSKPNVMQEFLTALVEAAKENINTEIKYIVNSIIKTRIKNISMEIEMLHKKIDLQKQIEKEESAMVTARFSKAIAMLKTHLGIKNNNSTKPDSETFPLFWMIREFGSQQEAIVVKHKTGLHHNTQELAINELELKQYQTADLSMLKFKVATISKNSYSLVRPKSNVIIGLGVAFGLLISIIIVFLIAPKGLVRAKENPSTST